MDLALEKEIIQKAKKDPEAFGQLFDQYYPKIMGYTLKRVGDVALAQDLTSETFFKALKKLNQFKWRGISISSWLYRIATNEINAHYRGKASRNLSLEYLVQQTGFDVADAETPEIELQQAQEELERHAQYQKVQSAISKLSIKYQEVLALRYFEQKKISEIASIVNKKEGTVKSLLSRGVSQLSAQMQPKLSSTVIEVEVEKHN